MDHERRAAQIIARAWLSYRDRQIFMILKSVVSVAVKENGHLVLQRISPLEAKLLETEKVWVRMKLMGESFPPKVIFKAILGTTGKVNYLSGREQLKEDMQGVAENMGETNFCKQLLSDLVERKQNKNVVDIVDVGSTRDLCRLLSYRDESAASVGGKGNTWRLVNLSDIPKAAPFRDLYEILQSKQLSILPKAFWGKTRNRENIERQILTLLQHNELKIPKPLSHDESKQRVQHIAEKRRERMTDLYKNKPNTASERSCVTVVDIGSLDLDYEARELYEWSQYL